jgi:hypothetical protein
MKIISYINEENSKLYDINTIMEIVGVSKSKIQREIKRNGISRDAEYKNQFLYSQNSLFTLMEKILIERINKEL